VKNLVLVGFMGTGKTVVGQRAAARLGHRFVDTDQRIEQRAGRTITELFATEGEARFRQRERAVIQELAAQQNLVIATGGGVVLNPDNLRDLEASGVVICLGAEPAVILQRTRQHTHRPLLHGPDPARRIAELLAERAPLYRAIAHRVDTSHTTVEENVEDVLAIYRHQTTGA